VNEIADMSAWHGKVHDYALYALVARDAHRGARRGKREAEHFSQT
jgi:hypothetical protein